MNFVGPAIGAVIFVCLMSLLRNPTRRTFNALLVAGSAGLYISGGFGPWELLYAAIVLPVAHRGLTSYRFIAIGWLMHSAWDLPHHFANKPLWPYMPTSSFGCVIFDALIAVWFLASAPTLIGNKKEEQSENDRG
jgi:hypothetical protein